MPHPKLVGAISDNVDGFSAYQFRSDATNTTSPDVIMLWNGIGPRTVTLSLSAGTYRVINMLGAERTESAGSGSLQLESAPIRPI
ncbi:MAG: hypothetical protein IPL39_05355 [Opitutaceae bacterium]|nr:hypothetical protein [Opitutaceae bacterium]